MGLDVRSRAASRITDAQFAARPERTVSIRYGLPVEIRRHLVHELTLRATIECRDYENRMRSEAAARRSRAS
jgi:hypothetical protein